MKKIFSLLAILTFAQFAHAKPVTIAGTVKNGTSKNAPEVGALVELTQPGDGGKNRVIATTRTDARGRYSFPTRDLTDKDLLFVNINHQGFPYFTVAYDGGNKLEKVGIKTDSSKADLMIFDTTNQAIPLKFQVHHLAVKSTETGINCIERIVVQNLSNRTLTGIGPNKVSVWLNVPKGATDVKLDSKIDGKLVKTSSGYGFVRPVTPDAYGVRNAIIFSYNIPWGSRLPWAKKVDLSRDVAYATDFFFVARMPDDKNIEVTAPLLGLASEQQLPIDGKTETRIVNAVGAPSMPGMPGANETGPALPAGKRMEVVISRPVNPIFWGFAGLTVALCLFLPLALVKPKKPKSPESSLGARRDEVANDPIFALHETGVQGRLNSQSQHLVRQIADLDDEFEAGQIEESTYQERRTELKKALITALSTA